MREAARPVLFFYFHSPRLGTSVGLLEIEGSRHVLDIKLGPRIADLSRGADSRVGGRPMVHSSAVGGC